MRGGAPDMNPSDGDGIYRDGRHYDLITAALAAYRMKVREDYVDDISFYVRQAEKYGGPVLELACGTGRVAIPIAEKGMRVTGLDISDSMLVHARRKAAERAVGVEWVRADCRDFTLNKKFRLIFLAFNSLGHLHDLESVAACFSCVRRHLTEEGRFIVDFFNPSLDILTRDPCGRYPVAEYPDPDGRGTVVVTESNTYEADTQMNRIRWHYKIGEEREYVEELNLRMFYPKELDALLHYNRFTIEAKFGDFDETSFASTSPKQIVICRAVLRDEVGDIISE
jgi:SAM-dependent methyltransferase